MHFSLESISTFLWKFWKDFQHKKVDTFVRCCALFFNSTMIFSLGYFSAPYTWPDSQIRSDTEGFRLWKNIFRFLQVFTGLTHPLTPSSCLLNCGRCLYIVLAVTAANLLRRLPMMSKSIFVELLDQRCIASVANCILLSPLLLSPKSFHWSCLSIVTLPRLYGLVFVL